MGASRTTALARYQWASDYIEGLIQAPPTPRPGATREEIRARALARIDRLRRFLAFAGDPQTKYRSVHIGGTSGKGSTSAFIASILHAAGYRTGLHTTPYLQVETEKLQIDGRLVAGDRFAEHVEALDHLTRRWAERGGDRLTYGEFWVALTFLAFARDEVDVAVVEVGAGGRFDLTNVILSDVAVITSIGLDHTRTLGGTLPEIAWHKAGIIKPGRPAVTTVTQPECFEVIQREAIEQGAPLTHLVPGRDFAFLGTDGTGSRVQYPVGGRVFELPLAGTFQGGNAAAAIGAARAFGEWVQQPISDEVIAKGLETTRFPGRMEIVQTGPRVILDGAHNPAKMTSLVRSVRLVGSPRRRIVVFGCLSSHDYTTQAQIVAEVADEVIVTAPIAVQRTSAPPEDLAAVIRQSGKPAEVVDDPREAIKLALARAEPADEILVTGSLYLVGEIREHWYHSHDIVLAQSCWPRLSARA